jgi:hypothetical protein
MPDLLEVAYCQGWEAGRADLMVWIASRADEIEATWRTVPRPTYEQRVAERLAEMEHAAARVHSELAVIRQSAAATRIRSVA